jgi:iron complex transport system ATP-binding protein
MNMLELRSVSAGYPGKKAITDITFSAARGDFWGIIGPNGAGKTTLFRAITRLITASSGSILFEGRDVAKTTRLELAGAVAAMLTLNGLPFSFTCGEFVMMGRYPHQKRFEKPSSEDLRVVDESLNFTDTLDFRDRKLNELSAGERQRVILAQALAQKPKLLLLDEPTAYLDIGHQIAILDLIRKLNREAGLTVITVLHDLNLAGEYCDKLLMLDNGRIHASGLPKEVLTFQNIEKVFKTVVVVKDNPISSKPYIILVSKENVKATGAGNPV